MRFRLKNFVEIKTSWAIRLYRLKKKAPEDYKKIKWRYIDPGTGEDIPGIQGCAFRIAIIPKNIYLKHFKNVRGPKPKIDLQDKFLTVITAVVSEPSHLQHAKRIAYKLGYRRIKKIGKWRYFALLR